MQPKEIRELIELIGRSNFETFELERDGLKLKLVKAAPPVTAPAPAAPASATVVATAGPTSVPEPAASAAAPAPVEDGLHELLSPIVGTFYRSATPDAAPFVDVGSRVKKGQVMCIVEAMKVMNEIESEIDAEIVEINIANAQPVEYGEVMFRLRPLS